MHADTCPWTSRSPARGARHARGCRTRPVGWFPSRRGGRRWVTATRMPGARAVRSWRGLCPADAYAQAASQALLEAVRARGNKLTVQVRPRGAPGGVVASGHGRGTRFGLGTRGLALWTGCLTRGEDQCLHRHPLSLFARGSHVGGCQGKRKPRPCRVSDRSARPTLHGAGTRTAKRVRHTRPRGSEITSGRRRRTTRESQTKRWRDKRSASD